MLSTTSEHALRALVELAHLPVDDAVLGRDLAHRAGIPGPYLPKVLGTLRNARIVGATRGSAGGYRLTERPGAIRLIDVVRLFEASTVDPDCLLGGGRPCRDEDPCSAHASWREVRRRFIHFLETTTIADLAASRPAPAAPAPLVRGAEPSASRKARGRKP